MRVLTPVAVCCALGHSWFLAAAAAEPVASDEIVSAYAPFTVVGVILATGQALLWDEHEPQYRVVRVGDVVAGWKVVAVEAARVVVTNGHARDELSLEEAPQPIALRISEPPPKAPRQLPTTTVEIKTRTKPAPAAPAIFEERRTVTRAELDRELGDFDRLLATVEVQAAEGSGFTLTRVDQGSWVWNLGLRPGDVIRSVSGEVVNTVEDAARVYARLRVAKKVSIEVDRAGTRLAIQIEVKK